MKKIFLIIFCTFFLTFCNYKMHAQLVVGNTAPDWTFTDLNGKSHNLYSYLNQGKAVVIDISATWCGPCWQYHTSNALENFYNQYGPQGTNKAMAFFIEGDASTNTACLSGPTGCNNNTYGDWTAGTPYPIMNPSSGTPLTSFKSGYKIAFFPTIYLICPDKKIKLASKQTGPVTFTTTQLKTGMDQCATTDINDIELDANIAVFPNPSAGNVLVDINTEGTKQICIKIYNNVGILISETNSIASLGQYELDLNELSNGLYFIEVIIDNSQTVKKIMLNK